MELLNIKMKKSTVYGSKEKIEMLSLYCTVYQVIWVWKLYVKLIAIYNIGRYYDVYFLLSLS